MNLAKATVTGFFSLPSPALAEANPTAYTLAMASAPEGAGYCHHCGMGILHHIVVRTEDGKTAFIGSDCAMRIGGEPARAAGQRTTTEQSKAKEASQEAKRAAYFAEAEANKAATLARWDAFKGWVKALLGDDLEAAWRADFEAGRGSHHGYLAPGSYGSCIDSNEFPHAMAAALIRNQLSPRMAECTVKLLMGRRTKANAAAWDAAYDRLLPA